MSSRPKTDKSRKNIALDCCNHYRDFSLHVAMRTFLMGCCRYGRLVRRVEEAESRIKMAGESALGMGADGAGGGGVGGGELALAAARGYHKVLSYKDEYEVGST